MIDALGNKVEVGDRVALSFQYDMRFGVMIEESAWYTPSAVIQLDDPGGRLTTAPESILKLSQTNNSSTPTENNDGSFKTRISNDLLQDCLEDKFRGNTISTRISDMILSMAQEIQYYRQQQNFDDSIKHWESTNVVDPRLGARSHY